MTEPLETLIYYRLGRAQESLDDARLLAEANRWNACVRIASITVASTPSLRYSSVMGSPRRGIRGCVVSSIAIMCAPGWCLGT